MVSKLSKTVTEGNARKAIFSYNKVAKRYICLAGHMATKVTYTGLKRNKTEGTPIREIHHFDVTKCKNCPLKKECGYKDIKSRTYAVTIAKDQVHITHNDLQKTEEYKQLAKERYKIEAKNAKLKNVYGYGKLDYAGIHGMTLHAAISIFAVNIKRIITLKNPPKTNGIGAPKNQNKDNK